MSAIKDFRRAEVQLWMHAKREAFEWPRTHPGIRRRKKKFIKDDNTYMEVAVGDDYKHARSTDTSIISVTSF